MIYEFDNYVEIDYENIPITVYGKKYDADDWDERYDTIDWTYKARHNDVAELIADLVSNEELIQNDIDILNDEQVYKYINDNFDSLLERFEKEIRNYFRNKAEEDAQENNEEEYNNYDEGDY